MPLQPTSSEARRSNKTAAPASRVRQALGAAGPPPPPKAGCCFWASAWRLCLDGPHAACSMSKRATISSKCFTSKSLAWFVKEFVTFAEPRPCPNQEANHHVCRSDEACVDVKLSGARAAQRNIATPAAKRGAAGLGTSVAPSSTHSQSPWVARPVILTTQPSVDQIATLLRRSKIDTHATQRCSRTKQRNSCTAPRA